jgi:hypothetical protein
MVAIEGAFVEQFSAAGKTVLNERLGGDPVLLAEVLPQVWANYERYVRRSAAAQAEVFPAPCDAPSQSIEPLLTT